MWGMQRPTRRLFLAPIDPISVSGYCGITVFAAVAAFFPGGQAGIPGIPFFGAFCKSGLSGQKGFKKKKPLLKKIKKNPLLAGSSVKKAPLLTKIIKEGPLYGQISLASGVFGRRFSVAFRASARGRVLPK